MTDPTIDYEKDAANRKKPAMLEADDEPPPKPKPKQKLKPTPKPKPPHSHTQRPRGPWECPS